MSKYEEAARVKEANGKVIGDFEALLGALGSTATYTDWEAEDGETNCPRFKAWIDDDFLVFPHDLNSVKARREIARTLGQMRAEIVVVTIDRLKAEIVKAAKDATEEAREMLRVAGEEEKGE